MKAVAQLPHEVHQLATIIATERSWDRRCEYTEADLPDLPPFRNRPALSSCSDRCADLRPSCLAADPGSPKASLAPSPALFLLLLRDHDLEGLTPSEVLALALAVRDAEGQRDEVSGSCCRRG